MQYSILSYLENTARRIPEKTAVIDESRSASWRELLLFSRRVGTALAQRGAFGRPVAVYMEKSIPALCAFFGATYAGGCYSFFNPELPGVRLKSIQSVLDAAVIVTSDELLEGARALFPESEVVSYSAIANTEIDEALLASARARAIDTDPLYINFTSGSTGTPKGIAVGHRSVIDFIDCFTELFSISESDVIANQAPFDFDVSVKDIYNAMKNGGTVVVVPKKLFMLPKLLLEFLCEYNINTMIWAVSALRIVSDFKALDAVEKMPDIRYITFSGEVMPVKALNYWIENVPEPLYVNLYGPTEITCNCSYYIVRGKQDEWKALPIGKAFPNTRILLLDEERKHIVTEQDKVGELCVAGTSLALGYWNNKEKTDDAFIQNPEITQYESKIYATGDMAYYNENGDLVFASRRDFQIKHMGHRIELGEIEVALNAIPFIETSCCLYNEKRGKIVCFYQSQCDDTAAIVKLLGEKLPKYMWPNIFKRYDKLPMNKNSKIDRVKLKEDI